MVNNQWSVRSGTVGGIDFNVVEGEVGGEDRKFLFPLMEVNGYLEGFILNNLGSLFFEFAAHSHSIFHDGYPVKEDVDSIWVYPNS